MAGIPKQQHKRGSEAEGAAALVAGNAGGRMANASIANCAPSRSEHEPACSTPSADDVRFMRRAIELAWRGAGWTNPNPLVGCVIVHNGRIIGEGWHERYGCAHAERNALADCARRAEAAAQTSADARHEPDNTPGSTAAFTPGNSEHPQSTPDDPAHGFAHGATAYVTLEPCCHTGKQPPCTEALIAAGIARVVVGSRDPNPLVAGKGCEVLRAAGIIVDADVLRHDCDELNPIFFHFITRKTPYVVAKWAMSADGKIACASGDARWVTGPEARADGHELRHRLAAICVGIGTVLADDPLLTCRRENASNQPIRVVLDSSLRIPEGCALVRSCAAGDAPLIVATCADVTNEQTPEGEKAARLKCVGVDVLAVAPDAAGCTSVTHLVDELGKRGIDSLLVEGGAGVLASFFEASLVNEAVVYVAPKVIGGADAPSPVAGIGAGRMAQAIALGRATSDVLGEDVKLMFAPNGHTRVTAQTALTRKVACCADADNAAQGGAPCSPAS